MKKSSKIVPQSSGSHLLPPIKETKAAEAKAIDEGVINSALEKQFLAMMKKFDTYKEEQQKEFNKLNEKFRRIDTKMNSLQLKQKSGYSPRFNQSNEGIADQKFNVIKTGQNVENHNTLKVTRRHPEQFFGYSEGIKKQGKQGRKSSKKKRIKKSVLHEKS